MEEQNVKSINVIKNRGKFANLQDLLHLIYGNDFTFDQINSLIPMKSYQQKDVDGFH